MKYKIKIEIVLVGKKGADWDSDIAAGMIRNHLELALGHLPWIRDNVSEIEKIDVQEVKEG